MTPTVKGVDLSWAAVWHRTEFTSAQAMYAATTWGQRILGDISCDPDLARWYMVTRIGLGGFEIIAWFRHAEDRVMWQLTWG